MSELKEVRIYGCGGAGINILGPLADAAKEKERGFAKIAPVFVDTSRSNMRRGVDENSVFLIEGLDGSGKKRDSNYHVIADNVNSILHKHKPTEINIIIHSASGGSGSVIGPVLASEMLARGFAVIVILIGSTDSKKEIENSLKTIQSYDVISNKRSRPVVAAYHQNSAETPRGKVDETVTSTLMVLMAMLSGENHELDTADVVNFLNYPAVTSFKPKLTQLEFYSGAVTPPKNHLLLSAMTLVDDSTSASVGQDIEYQAVGYIPDDVRKNINTKFPLHAVLIDGGFHVVADELHGRLKAMDEVRGTYKERNVASDAVHQAAKEDGLVF